MHTKIKSLIYCFLVLQQQALRKDLRENASRTLRQRVQHEQSETRNRNDFQPWAFRYSNFEEQVEKETFMILLLLLFCMFFLFLFSNPFFYHLPGLAQMSIVKISPTRCEIFTSMCRSLKTLVPLRFLMRSLRVSIKHNFAIQKLNWHFSCSLKIGSLELRLPVGGYFIARRIWLLV